MKLRIQSRSAFTLIEILIVVAVIAVLMALMMPAIQATRESARRTQCSNNLKQIGVALHLYHDLNSMLPRGGWFPTTPAHSWCSAILPYLDQKGVYNQINVNVPYTDAANTTVGKIVLPIFLCPTAPKPTVLRRSVDVPSTPQEYARSCYAAVNGEQTLRSPSGTNDPERGAMMFESNVSFTQITDGISQTILVGEAPEGANSLWMSVRNTLDQSSPINTLANPATPYVFTDFGQEISSHHLHGAFVVLADGSAHFLMEKMENRILAALCSRQGGDVIDSGF